MEGFLDKLEKEYELFRITNFQIIKLFKFSDDIYAIFKKIFMSTNSFYEERCKTFGNKIDSQNTVFICLDKSGKCYLKVLGNDNHTILIIRSNSSNYSDYADIIGTKIIERDFLNYLDKYQTSKLENANLSKRFIKDEIPPINGYEEMDIQKLISYYIYLNNNYFKELEEVEYFDEPENMGGKHNKLNLESVPRKNDIVDYSVRKAELLKYKPIRQIIFEGSKTDIVFEAFVYQKDGFVLGIIEPISGVGYQYTLNLGPIDINDKDLIRDMLKAALEAEEKTVLMDDAIMRKNHTSLETFKDNLETFLNNGKNSMRFYYDIKNANQVYRV